VLEFDVDRTDMLEQRPAGFSRVNALRDPRQKLNADGRFQPMDAAGERGLRQADCLGGAIEAARVDDRLEVQEIFEVAG
jgi:hypothetical protein